MNSNMKIGLVLIVSILLFGCGRRVEPILEKGIVITTARGDTSCSDVLIVRTTTNGRLYVVRNYEDCFIVGDSVGIFYIGTEDRGRFEAVRLY